jgi:cell division protease FtsH
MNGTDKKNNKKAPNHNPDEQQGKMGKNMMFWLFISLGVISLLLFFQDGNKSDARVSYSQYKEFLDKGLITEATIIKTQMNDYEFYGKLSSPVTINVDNKKKKVVTFVTKLGVLDTETELLWEAKGIELKYEQGDDFFWSTIITLLPLVLLFVLMIFLFRRMQGGGGGQRGLFNFGKARIKLLDESLEKVTFKDVAGIDEAKYELEEVIEFLKEPSKFKKLGGKIPKGVLLLGAPGTGKTLLARAVAGEAGVPFFSMSGADFVEMFVGVGASRVRDLFEQAKKSSPCLVFIDEIDAVGRQRGAGVGGGHDEREQTLNQLLVEMDGFEQNSGIIIIAATNRPDVLDPALLRPGRFDRQVVVDRPDVVGREGIFAVHTRKIPLSDDVDLKILARGTPGLSGADIANVINEAALFAARRNSDKVTMYDFENAKDKILMGIERRSLVISDKEKEMTAYHEMGHVLIGKLVPKSDPVHKVTIIPRGRALGVTASLPEEDLHSYSKEYIDAKLIMLMGGRAAEKLVFGNTTSGASNDIKRATDLARKMVCDWGMSDVIGPVNYATSEDELFLGREIAHQREFSESTQEKIDEEVKNILFAASATAEELLSEKIDLLHSTSKILLERETLDAVEIEMLMQGEELPPINLSKLNAIKSMNIKSKRVDTIIDDKVTDSVDNKTEEVSSENKNI